MGERRERCGVLCTERDDMTPNERTTLEDLLEECEMVGMAVSAVLEDDAAPADLAQALRDLRDATMQAMGALVVEEDADA